MCVVVGGREHSPWSETELCVKVVNSHVSGGLVVCVAQLLLSGEAWVPVWWPRTQPSDLPEHDSSFLNEGAGPSISKFFSSSVTPSTSLSIGAFGCHLYCRIWFLDLFVPVSRPRFVGDSPHQLLYLSCCSPKSWNWAFWKISLGA